MPRPMPSASVFAGDEWDTVLGTISFDANGKVVGLRIVTDEETFTDTESLFLPEAVDEFPDPDQNFTLYKLTAVHLWAQTWYGTWRFQVLEKLMRQFDTDRVLPIFNRLECLRLDACLARGAPT